MSGRLDYAPSTEAAINEQIGMEMQASHNYRALAAHFSHPRLAYPGIAAFFSHNFEEESEHAQKFIDFQNARHGVVKIPALSSPVISINSIIGSQTNDIDFSPYAAFECALNMEKAVTEALIKLHNDCDNQTEVFLEPFLEEQTKSLNELSILLTQVSRIATDVGHLYIFDRELASRFSK